MPETRVTRDSDRIYVESQGGIGNQLFIYAFARNLKETQGAPVVIDTWQHSLRPDRSFAIAPLIRNVEILRNKGYVSSPFTITHFVNRLRASRLGLVLNPKTLRERTLNFDPTLLHVPTGVRLRGYFQSWKYFQEVNLKLGEELRGTRETLARSSKSKRELPTAPTVAVHIRRGDFMRRKSRLTHPTLPQSYYVEALAFLRSHQDFEAVRLFSDAPVEARHFLQQCTNLPILLDETQEGDDLSSLLDLSTHSAIVMANSTFSWWGSWISGLPGRAIVAPRSWSNAPYFRLEDLIPLGWTCL